MRKQTDSSDESFQRITPPVPVSANDLDGLPSPHQVTVLPPIVLDDDEEVPESVIEASLRLQKPVPPGTRRPSRRRRFFGLVVPRRYADLPWYSLILLLLTDRKALGTLASISIHLFLFILLSMIIFQSKTGSQGEPLDVGFSTNPGELEMVQETGVTLDLENGFDSEMQTRPEESLSSTMSMEQLTQTESTQVESTPSLTGNLPETVQLPQSGAASLPVAAPIVHTGGSTKGRTADIRKRGMPGREGDTTDQSEYAVEAGLKWLANHQLPDGGWAFDLNAKDKNDQAGYCRGACSNTFATSGGHSMYRRGLHPSRMAATALSILPFLGAGYTHKPSEKGANTYQKTVYAGLEYLKYGSRTSPNGMDFRAGLLGQGMYIQGIVTLVFCEAFEMSGDETLRPYAQEGLRFIEAAQREDGGWRYHTRLDTDYIKDVSGDTTVTGWQMLAIKSGLSAGLQVRTSLLYKVGAFLDGLQSKDGSTYHYTKLKNEAGMEKMWGTTAVGLLLRLYLGWTLEKPGMKKGVGHLVSWITESNRNWQLAKKGEKQVRRGDRVVQFYRQAGDGPTLYVHNLYFSYYAMLTLHNLGGSDWHRSFKMVRDFLIETQAVRGHEMGSWLFYDQYMNDGGRLLNTALAILVLETPYRYLPMYK